MNNIVSDFDNISFLPGNKFIWSPETNSIYFDSEQISQNIGQLALLHEIGHATLKHLDYRSDINLLNMELDAWSYARKAAAIYGVNVDEAHIDNCIETYRIWVYKRSICPACSHHGVQIETTKYRCFICTATWKVAKNLSIQPHRMSCISPIR